MINMDAIKKDLDTFQTTGYPLDYTSFRRSMSADYSNLIQALYFFERGNRQVAFMLGLAIGKKMLPLCTAENKDGQPVDDPRPQQLYDLIHDYVKTGNWESMLQAQEIGHELNNSHNYPPKHKHFDAVHALTELTSGQWNFSIVPSLFWVTHAYTERGDQQGLDTFMNWLQRTFQHVMEDISYNDMARHNAGVNKMIKEQDGGNASIIWNEDTRELLKNEL